MHTRALAFWIPTALVALGSTLSGLGYLSGGMDDAFRHLGYPLYFAPLLGSAKVLGSVALLTPPSQPWIARLKEWAYAGFTFTFLGAIVSHLAVGDGVGGALAPALFLGLLGISYATRPAGSVPSTVSHTAVPA